MATAVDICNLALTYIGAQGSLSSIDPPEGSPQADNCARYWPIALGQALREYAWSFATVRKPLSEFKVGSPGWGYAYAYPSDCAQLIGVYDESGIRLTNVAPMRINGVNAIATTYPAKTVEYITTEVDTSTLPSDFCDALAHLLAAKIAGAMIAGSSGAQVHEEQLKIYMVQIRDVIKRDAKQFRERVKEENPFMGDYHCEGEFVWL